jgi:hypothetical protein
MLSAFKSYQIMRMRIVLALGTGLGCGDIKLLSVSDLDFENRYVIAVDQTPAGDWL